MDTLPFNSDLMAFLLITVITPFAAYGLLNFLKWYPRENVSNMHEDTFEWRVIFNESKKNKKHHKKT